jgi:serine/threonine protein kinase
MLHTAADRITGPFKRLGEGAFGEVLEAFDSENSCRVAIKRIFVKSSWALPPSNPPPPLPPPPTDEPLVVPSPSISPRSLTVKSVKSSPKSSSSSSKLDLSIDGLSLLKNSHQNVVSIENTPIPTRSPSPSRKRALTKYIPSPDCGFFSLAAFRELQSLRHLQCQNIVELKGYYVEPGALVLILERLSLDLGAFLSSLQHRRQTLPDDVIVTLAEGLLRGLEHCHLNGIMHRDIKPGNILLSEHGVLKLADFGIARPIIRQDGIKSLALQNEYTNQVSSRWYRAPEVLFGATCYGTAIDMWAAGLIIAELFNGKPLLPGSSDIEQLARVMAARGTPLETCPPWKGAKDLPDFKKVTFKPTIKPAIQSLVPTAPLAALDLIDSLLTLDPARRPTASIALSHSYFKLPHAPFYEIVSLIDEALLDLSENRKASVEEL